ncbi:Hpt domain-containing protein [Pararhodobacter sp.]|uniref:Hpt domain-containing protein n=1 Tax=Pararhodobacter sp. TaxID=2127056 RepID=UPI002FDE358A
MIDWAQVDEMRLEMGNGFNEVVTMFLDEVGEVIVRLESGPEPDSLGADLHFLKGAALNLGFSDFAELCERGEKLALENRFAEVDVNGLLICYRASCEVFRAGLNLNAA